MQYLLTYTTIIDALIKESDNIHYRASSSLRHARLSYQQFSVLFHFNTSLHNMINYIYKYQ